MLREITKIVGEPEGAAEVVSVYQCGAPSPPRQADPSAPPDRPADSTTSCVWVSVKEGEGSFVNSVKLQGLLTLHAGQVSSCVRCAERHAHARKFTRTHTYTHIKRHTELRRYTLFFLVVVVLITFIILQIGIAYLNVLCILSHATVILCNRGFS